MKLGDNGEAFFVEETEEEYVSSSGSYPLSLLYSGLWCMSQKEIFSFQGYLYIRKELEERRRIFSPCQISGFRENAEGLHTCFVLIRKGTSFSLTLMRFLI